MSDLIQREDALLCLTGEFEKDKEYSPEELIAIFGKRLRSLPPVTPAVKTGYWIHLSKCDKCSECGYETGRFESESNYCPNCGIKMEGK